MSQSLTSAPENKIKIDKEAKCYICGNLLLHGGKQVGQIDKDKDGLCHHECLMILKPELKIAFLVNCWSIGDNIACTPALREVRRLYPKAEIKVVTMFPDLWKYNPDLNGIVQFNYGQDFTIDGFDIIMNAFDVFSPDRSFHWNTHGAQFSVMCVLRKTLPYSMLEYHVDYTIEELDKMKVIVKENGIDLAKPFILVHPYDSEWETRCWGVDRWQSLIDKLIEQYPTHQLIAIGGSRSGKKMPNYHLYDHIISLYDKMDLLETLALMDHEQCKLIVTFDTAPLHMAGCTEDTPIVGIFSLVHSFYRTPVRNRTLGYKFIAVDSEAKCSCTNDQRIVYEKVNLESCYMRRVLKLCGNYKLRYDQKSVVWSKYFDGELSQENLHEKNKQYETLPCMPSVDRVLEAIKLVLG